MRSNRMRRALFAILCVVLMTPAGSAAGRPWRSIRGPNVIVFGQQSAGTLHDVAVEIEHFRFVVAELIRGAQKPLPLPTLVFAFDDARALQPYVPLYKGKPISLAGFCHCGGADDVSVIAASLHRGDETSSIVFHEYTHLLTRVAAKGIPVWLNEGLAEYFSTFQLRSGGREAMVGRPLLVHLALLNQQRLLPVLELLAVDAKSPMYNEGERRSIFYAESWALTHYLLIDRPGGVEGVNKYLAAAAKGPVAPQALADALGTTLKELDVELARYVRHPAFGFASLKLKDKVEVDEPEAVRAVPDAEAEARLGDLLMRVGRLDEAEPRIEAAAGLAPNNATTQLALGQLRVRQDRDADSVAPLKRAAALAPNDFVSQYLFALTMLRRALDLKLEEAMDATTQAKEALARALTIDAESANALAWHAYADMELDRGGAPGNNLARWQEARDETLKAIALAPGRTDFQLQLALIYLRERSTEQAGRSLLATVAEQTTEESVATRARGVIEELRERDTRAANAPFLGTPGSSRRRDGGSLRNESVEVGPAGDKVREHTEAAATELHLRKVQAGEERALGELVAMDCTSSGVRFHVRSGSGTIVAGAAKMEDVEMISFLDTELAVKCGPHAPAERVYLTWKPGGPGSPVPTAVAVEFLPRTYIP
jgi:tetratricopeptide (TPR) repeat protein